MLKIVFTSILIIISISISESDLDTFLHVNVSPEQSVVANNIEANNFVSQSQKCASSFGRLQAYVVPNFPGVFCQGGCAVGYCCEIVPKEEL